RVSCTCVRVPVIRSHSESITIEFDKEVDVEKARALLAQAPGVRVVDDLRHSRYPMPLETSDQDLVFVGRLREDISDDTHHSLTFWCCGDQVRKGAATNAVQIAEQIGRASCRESEERVVGVVRVEAECTSEVYQVR